MIQQINTTLYQRGARQLIAKYRLEARLGYEALCMCQSTQL
jgi:hypothetical protein